MKKVVLRNFRIFYDAMLVFILDQVFVSFFALQWFYVISEPRVALRSL